MQTKPAGNQGLTLPFRALRRLREVGVFARAGVSLEYQQLATRYVVRGVESGGAIDNLGHYVTFCGEDGTPLAWLHPLDGIGVNGVHALVVAPVLVRVEMFRRGQTYDVLIARFAPGPRTNGRRPTLQATTVFHAAEGYLAVDLVKRERDRRGLEVPTFYSRAGEPLPVPGPFESVTRAVTAGVNCVACPHSHYLCAPEEAATAVISPITLPDADDSPPARRRAEDGGAQP
jgi:hypothetical protein